MGAVIGGGLLAVGVFAFFVYTNFGMTQSVPLDATALPPTRGEVGSSSELKKVKDLEANKEAKVHPEPNEI